MAGGYVYLKDDGKIHMKTANGQVYLSNSLVPVVITSTSYISGSQRNINFTINGINLPDVDYFELYRVEYSSGSWPDKVITVPWASINTGTSSPIVDTNVGVWHEWYIIVVSTSASGKANSIASNLIEYIAP